MAGADDGYFPKPENRNPVFGNGRQSSPYFEEDGPPAFASKPEQPHQLQLDDDVRLPWLEGDDEDVADRPAGPGRGMILGALGLLALVAVGGAIVWAVKSTSDQELVADGGVIAAPREPYKSRPDDPGGEVVAGTGDTSFAVAEGQSRPVQIGKGDTSRAPGFETAMTPDAKATDAPAPAVTGVGVQVGAYASREAAEQGWTTLTSQHEPLAAVSHLIVQGRADIGTVYRLQAVPGDAAAARALCAGMKAAGMSCQVKN